MKEIKAYECEHCNKVMKYKKSMEKHELGCMAGKEPRNCFACDKAYFVISYESYGHVWYKHRTCDFCKKIQICEDEIHTNLALQCEHFNYTPDRLFTGIALEILPFRDEVIKNGNYQEVRKKQLLN